MRLFRNGSLVRVWRGDVLKGRAAALETEITVEAGENVLTAYAFNNDDIKSADATLELKGASALARKGVARLVAVGVNAYANPRYDLKYAVADAVTFGEEFKRQQERLGRYERVEVKTLTDRQATKAGILRALEELSAVAEPEDAVVVFFAGHGTARDNRFYLLPHDLGYAGAPSALDRAGLEAMLAHGVSDRELERAFEKIDAARILFVIDACNSGQALEAAERRRGPMNSKGLAQLAYEKGMYILTASQSYEAAQEASQLGHGLLTYALVEEGLKRAAADTEPKDGTVHVKEWLDFAARRVPEIQLEEMSRAATSGRDLSFAEEERGITLARRQGQRPRLYYRRELEAHPLVVAKTRQLSAPPADTYFLTRPPACHTFPSHTGRDTKPFRGEHHERRNLLELRPPPRAPHHPRRLLLRTRRRPLRLPPLRRQHLPRRTTQTRHLHPLRPPPPQHQTRPAIDPA